MIALAAFATACVPPNGLGPAPAAPRRGTGVVTGSAGVGASAKRESFQVSGTTQLRTGRIFLIEGGLVYTLMRAEAEDGSELIAHSALPYVRPTFLIGPIQLGIALSGLGMGGGGGGAAYGVFGVRTAYVKDRVSAFTEWLVHGSTVSSESPISASSTQYRAGIGYSWDVGGTELGGSLELADIDESFRADNQRFSAHHVGAMLKLTVRSSVK